MLKSIMKMFWNIGMYMEEYDTKRSTYKPNYDGQFVNKGKRGEEDWQWVEKVKPLRPYYVNVFNIEDDYVISVGLNTRPNAIERVKCEDEAEAEIAVRYLKIYYECLGNVTTHSEIE